MTTKRYTLAFLILTLLPCIKANAQAFEELHIEEAEAQLREVQAEVQVEEAQLRFVEARLEKVRVEYRIAIAQNVMGSLEYRLAEDLPDQPTLLRESAEHRRETANRYRDPAWGWEDAYRTRLFAEAARKVGYTKRANILDQVADVKEQIAETRERTGDVYDQIADVLDRTADVYEDG